MSDLIDDNAVPVVTDAPAVIWLCYGDVFETQSHAALERDGVEVTWCQDKQDVSDVRYVRADTAAERIAELEADNARLRVDGERWQAFLNCGRVKLFGWAGVNKKPGEPSYNEVGYVHFGGEFWTNAFEEKYYSAADKAQAQEVLIAFADGAIKTAQLAARKTP